jgi:hypothetical protein
MTIIPKPILAQRDLLFITMPLITLSIPTISKMIPIINTTDAMVIAGLTIKTMARTIAMAPRPIRAARDHPGAFGSDITQIRN